MECLGQKGMCQIDLAIMSTIFSQLQLLQLHQQSGLGPCCSRLPVAIQW